MTQSMTGLYYRGGDIADVEYSYNGKHHKRVNIRCDVFDTLPSFLMVPDVEMDEWQYDHQRKEGEEYWWMVGGFL